MKRLTSKACPKCDGTGHGAFDSSNRAGDCKRCDGTGRIPDSVKRVAHVEDPQIGDVVIELRENGVFIRRKGKRTVYGPLSFLGLFMAGARQYAELRRLEAKGRKAGRATARRKRIRRGGI